MDQPGDAFRRRSIHAPPAGWQHRVEFFHTQPNGADDATAGEMNSRGEVHLEELPPVLSVPDREREELIVKKCVQCEVICNFDSDFHDVRNKEVKRQALQDLKMTVSRPELVTPKVLEAFMRMVERNLERDWAAPEHPNAPEYDPEEDTASLNREWPHVQLVYEGLLAMLESPTARLNFAKEYINRRVIMLLLGIFSTEDTRERNQVKTALHRLYSKFVSHRSYVRSAINSVYYAYMYDRPSTTGCIGIAELLEISGSIINGFSLPIKPEHKRFLEKVLVPLHATDGIQQYSHQLTYCIVQFVMKDPNLLEIVVKGLLRYWPKCNSTKEVMFLHELEDLVGLVAGATHQHVMEMIFKRVAKCARSVHFQVAERAFWFFNGERVVDQLEKHSDVLIPLIVPVLHQQQQSHWSSNVSSLAESLLERFSREPTAQPTVQRTLVDLKRKREESEKGEEERRQKWQRVVAMATVNSPVATGREVHQHGLYAKSPLPTRRAFQCNFQPGPPLEAVVDETASPLTASMRASSDALLEAGPAMSSEPEVDHSTTSNEDSAGRTTNGGGTAGNIQLSTAFAADSRADGIGARVDMMEMG